MRIKFIAILALVYMGLSTPAEANTWWSNVGAACTPASNAIQNNLYTISGGSILGPVSGTSAVFYCPVHFLRFEGSPSWLIMTSKGQNGGTPPLSTSGITAQLIAMNLNSGAETVLATVSGTSSPTSVQNFTYFGHTFNFELNYYYVKVTISGSGTSVHQKTLNGVFLASECPSIC